MLYVVSLFPEKLYGEGRPCRALAGGPRRLATRARGVSLLEVLFAILVTTVGLLGAIAIFPVASSRARQARINDAAAVAGRSAVHAFDTRGMRRPDRWYAWNPATGQFVSKFAAGQAYCIDTRFLVRNTTSITTGNRLVYPEYFPYASPLNGVPPASLPRMERIAFFPGRLDTPPPPNPPNLLRDQFDRRNLVTFVAGQPAFGRNLLLADSIFVLEDDLEFRRPGRDDLTSLGLPADRSLPALQLFDVSGSVPLQRLAQGRFSWMATVVPKVEASAASDEYVLSVVVFHDRPNDLYLTPYASGGNENVLERVVNVAFNVPGVLSNDGTSGGEVLLYVPNASIPAGSLTAQEFAEERLKLRAGDWLMLAGIYASVIPGPTPTTVQVPRFQWYRVVHVSPDIVYESAASGLPDRYERYATLAGQDWNTGLLQQYAMLMEGVVAVYEKTIRLEYGSSE